MARSGNTRVIHALRSATSVIRGEPDVLPKVLDSAIELTGAERGFIATLDQAGKFAVRVARNFGGSGVPLEQTEISQSLCTLAVKSNQSVVSFNPQSDPKFPRGKSRRILRVRSELVAPLVAGGETLGAIVLQERTRENPFAAEEKRLLEAIAGLAGPALALVRQNESLRKDLEQARTLLEKRRFKRIVGSSEALRALLARLERVCDSDVPVLILGESGSGKDVVAHSLHEEGRRKDGPYVAINVTALPDALLEDELFGHAKGAFTGADRLREGLFQQANGGTLFLDEIGDMPLPLQAKLLRVLEDKEVRPVGASTATKVDVRIVAATHRDLEKRVREGKFREDQFYRLNVVRLETPPLRERREDVPLLARFFLEKVALEHGKPAPRLSREALAALERHRWPGNVRELDNVMRRAFVLGNDPIETADLGLAKTRPEKDLRRRGERFTDDEFRAAYAAAKGEVSDVLAELGMSRASFFRYKKRLKLR